MKKPAEHPQDTRPPRRRPRIPAQALPAGPDYWPATAHEPAAPRSLPAPERPQPTEDTNDDA